MKIANRIITIGTAAVLLLVVITVAKANCPGCPPPGGTLNCMAACTAMNQITGGPQGTFTTNGNGVFNIVSSDPAAKLTELQPAAWTGTGKSDKLGDVTWSFDVTRPVDNSTIQSNGNEDFPATGNLYFHVTGTMSAYPNITYQSINPLHLQNTNLMSFDPFQGEVFTNVEPIDFEDVRQPGKVAFVLKDLTLTLN